MTCAGLVVLLLATTAETQTAEPPAAPSDTPSTAKPETAPEKEFDWFDWGVFALAAYNSDEGLVVGGDVTFFFRQPEYEPYRYKAELFLSVSTGGVQWYGLRFDALNLLGTGFRADLWLSYERDLFRPYYGIGNTTQHPGSAFVRELHAHQLTWLGGTLGLERKLGGAWESFFSVTFGRSRVVVTPEAILALERPTGVEGGFIGEYHAELAFDTRDLESSSTRGVYVSLAARLGHFNLSSPYLGGAATARGFISPFGTPHLVLGGRVVVDALSGDVPFNRLHTFAGRTYILGLGSAQSVRGVPRLLYIGRIKAVANLEARSRFVRFTPGDHKLDLWLIAFADAGRAWADWAPDGPLERIHTSLGGGLRVGWEEDYIIRLDVAFSPGHGMGVYIDFGQVF